jgi:glutamate dehydrogenase (NADP+)
MSDIVKLVQRKDPGEKEFQQAVQAVIESVKPVLDRHPEYRQASILERLIEPDQIIMFRVPWVDDQGYVRVNRGYQVEMNGAVGPHVGGLRFHASVNLSILKFLAFEQVFKNALTTLSMGGAQGGADFDPKGKSENEIMRFCQNFMIKLHRHLGPDTAVPGMDIGVGTREIGYLFGMYRTLKNEFNGALTGKSLTLGGSLIRPEATGYGNIYFSSEMLATKNDTLEGKACLISGSGNVALHNAEKLIELGAKVVTLSDSSGHIYDEEGIDAAKLDYVKRLKYIRRARIREYVDKYSEAVYVESDAHLDYNPIWTYPADCAFPCATQNEINEEDALNLVQAGVTLVSEGADMPCKTEAVQVFLDNNILYAPGKASNAGGIAVSGLEMAQNSARLNWTREEVDNCLKKIIKSIHQTCLDAAAEYEQPGNYLAGANIASFVKVVNAMLSQGIV